MMTNFYNSLNQLVTDARFRNLTVTQNFETFFNANGINESEHMYTLSWLLSPNGSHGLQDTFIKELMTNAWTLIQDKYDYYKGSKCFERFATLSPVSFQQYTYAQAYVDRQTSKEVPCADIVITDVNSKTMIVINNKFNQTNCESAYKYFTGEKYNFFANKMFITCDAQVQSTKSVNWLYMNNEWIINLCSSIIESGKYSYSGICSYLKDYYQFLTGCKYGVAHDHISSETASLVKDYFEVITSLRTFKCEKIANVNLFDITPRDYATTYFGKLSENEYSVLSLCWAYRNTFNTFFQMAEMETVSKELYTSFEKRPYSVESNYIRNGYRFDLCFEKVRNDKSFVNSLFSVEMIQDMNKNVCLNLVVNKGSWDKLTNVQRVAFQKDFGFSTVLKDHVIVWNRFYGQTWNYKEVCQEITNIFGKIDTGLSVISVKVA